MHEELFDIMALTDCVISRSGANTLYELLVLKKPHVLIPLSKKFSRGDQIDNAKYFQSKGLSLVVDEENFNKTTLLTELQKLETNLAMYKQNLENYNCQPGTENIINIIRVC